ncbi:hypothetical protein BU15DRAFT_83075 [Melanogaster broomeanus]|nr:hypothetical protein BU15DRAFT_83075 [Melanogaster broomeanus]
MSQAITEIAELRTSKAGLYILISGQWQFWRVFFSTETSTFSLTNSQLFDYVITIQEEARWVWGRSWDATRVIFMVSRYLPFPGTALIAYVALRSKSDRIRQLKVKFSAIHVIGIIASETLLILRTYAFWQRSKRLLYGLIAYGAVTTGAAIAMNLVPSQLLALEAVQQLPSDPSQPSCLLESSGHGALVYVALLLYEIVILALMVYKRFHAYRGSYTLIVRIIYRDGVFYALFIIFITLANVIIGLTLPNEYSDLLETTRVLHKCR